MEIEEDKKLIEIKEAKLVEENKKLFHENDNLRIEKGELIIEIQDKKEMFESILEDWKKKLISENQENLKF